MDFSRLCLGQVCFQNPAATALALDGELHSILLSLERQFYDVHIYWAATVCWRAKFSKYVLSFNLQQTGTAAITSTWQMRKLRHKRASSSKGIQLVSGRVGIGTSSVRDSYRHPAAGQIHHGLSHLPCLCSSPLPRLECQKFLLPFPPPMEATSIVQPPSFLRSEAVKIKELRQK